MQLVRFAAITAAFVFACGGSTPEPREAEPPENTVDPNVAEVERLRAQLDELSGRLESATNERDALVRTEAELAAQRDAVQAELDELKRPKVDPNIMYSVPLGTGTIDGRADALVTIVVATEAACRYCWKIEDTFESLKKEYGKDLRIVYQTKIIHQQTAWQPAYAFCAASQQGKGLKMWKAIRKQYEAYEKQRDPKLFDRDAQIATAKALRLRMKKFKKDMDGKCQTIIKAQDKAMEDLGIAGTPTSFVNGKVIHGSKGIDEFRKRIDVELAKAREMVARGLDRKSVYDAIVAFGDAGPIKR